MSTLIRMDYALMILVFVMVIDALESSEIRMLESDYDKRTNRYQMLLKPDEYMVMERRNARLMDPLIRFGKRNLASGINFDENYLNRNIRSESFQSSPLIRFGKRSSTTNDMESLQRFNRNPEQRDLVDETVLRFGRSQPSMAPTRQHTPAA